MAAASAVFGQRGKRDAALVLREEGERGEGVVELAGLFQAGQGARRSEGGRLARHGVAVAHRRSFSTCAQGGSAAWRGRTGWRGPGWANPVPGRWPGRRAARGRRPRTRPALDSGGERAERRERIRGLIQNSNFSQRFFLEHEKL